MKTTDIAQTPIVKRYGVHGARIFGRIWFSAMYLTLVAIVVGWLMVVQEIPGGWRRAFIACFVGTLAVLATALLTRMQLKYRTEIDQFEAKRSGDLRGDI